MTAPRPYSVKFWGDDTCHHRTIHAHSLEDAQAETRRWVERRYPEDGEVLSVVPA